MDNDEHGGLVMAERVSENRPEEHVPKLSDQEIRALRSMSEFKEALHQIELLDILADRDHAKKWAAFHNEDGTYNHDNPYANKYTHNGMSGKAAGGDWYMDH
jgi:hypothetical protein